jgi:hypothetical protein
MTRTNFTTEITEITEKHILFCSVCPVCSVVDVKLTPPADGVATWGVTVAAKP